MENISEIVENLALQTCVPTWEDGFCYYELGVSDCPANCQAWKVGIVVGPRLCWQKQGRQATRT